MRVENGLEEEEMLEMLEYLVVGKFERCEGDRLGAISTLWLSVADLDASALTDEAMDAAMAEWEAEEAHLRKESFRLARAERRAAR